MQGTLFFLSPPLIVLTLSFVRGFFSKEISPLAAIVGLGFILRGYCTGVVTVYYGYVLMLLSATLRLSYVYCTSVLRLHYVYSMSMPCRGHAFTISLLNQKSG